MILIALMIILNITCTLAAGDALQNLLQRITKGKPKIVPLNRFSSSCMGAIMDDHKTNSVQHQDTIQSLNLMTLPWNTCVDDFKNFSGSELKQSVSSVKLRRTSSALIIVIPKSKSEIHVETQQIDQFQAMFESIPSNLLTSNLSTDAKCKVTKFVHSSVGSDPCSVTFDWYDYPRETVTTKIIHQWNTDKDRLPDFHVRIAAGHQKNALFDGGPVALGITAQDSLLLKAFATQTQKVPLYACLSLAYGNLEPILIVSDSSFSKQKLGRIEIIPNNTGHAQFIQTSVWRVQPAANIMEVLLWLRVVLQFDTAQPDYGRIVLSVIPDPTIDELPIQKYHPFPLKQRQSPIISSNNSSDSASNTAVIAIIVGISLCIIVILAVITYSLFMHAHSMPRSSIPLHPMEIHSQRQHKFKY